MKPSNGITSTCGITRVAVGADKVDALFKEVLASPMHRWFDDDNHGFNIMKERMKAEAEANIKR